jgi:hypothetical protein
VVGPWERNAGQSHEECKRQVKERIMQQPAENPQKTVKEKDNDFDRNGLSGV